MRSGPLGALPSWPTGASTATRKDLPARNAAVAALREALPEMPAEQAEVEAAHAIAYAAANHTEWFWAGV